MKSFYLFEDFDQLKTLNLSYNNINNELTNFFNSFSKEDNIKLAYLKKHSLVTMYTLLLHNKHLSKVKDSGRVTDNDFYNLNAFYLYDIEENRLNRDKVKKDFKNFVINRTLCPLHFKNTIELIKSKDYLSTGWIMFYKDNSIVPTHTHPESRLILHHALKVDGEYTIEVNNESKSIKEGEYFMFPGHLPHNAKFVGKEAIFLVLLTNIFVE